MNMIISYNEKLICHNYKVILIPKFYFAYPRANFLYDGTIDEPFITNYKTPAKNHPKPSEDLLDLIKNEAPKYIIIDKLCEEYPEFEECLLTAYYEHLESVSTALAQSSSP